LKLKTGHLAAERFVIFSTQVPDTLTNTPKHVKMWYQPKVYIILILKVMPFEPPRALSVDTSQGRDNLPSVALAEGPKQIKNGNVSIL
jgi:hypothetical protein